MMRLLFTLDNRSIQRGWSGFRKAHKHPCECSHPHWAHMGLSEPGCSFLGRCECVQYRAKEDDGA